MKLCFFSHSDIHLSTQKKWEIVFLSNHRRGPHLNYTQIAKKVNVNVKTVRYWLDQYEKTRDVEEKNHQEDQEPPSS